MVAAATPGQLLQRRMRVAVLYSDGETMAAIGQIEGISPSTVYADVCWAREQWRTKAASAIEAHKQRELSRIDLVEVEAWKGWKRSCKPALTEREKTGSCPDGASSESSRELKHQSGDPRFLQIIDGCIESRRKILGLDAPAKSTIELTGETLEAMVARRRQKLAQNGRGD